MDEYDFPPLNKDIAINLIETLISPFTLPSVFITRLSGGGIYLRVSNEENGREVLLEFDNLENLSGSILLIRLGEGILEARIIVKYHLPVIFAWIRGELGIPEVKEAIGWIEK